MASKKELQRKHEEARLDVERARRNKNYLDFLDAAAKGEERSYEQYRAHQRYLETTVADRNKAAAEAKKKKQELYDVEFSIRDVSADLLKLTEGMRAPFASVLGLSRELLETRQKDTKMDLALLNSAEKRAEATEVEIKTAENRLAVNGALGNLEKSIMTQAATGMFDAMSEEEILQKLKDDGLDTTKLTVDEMEDLEKRVENISAGTEKLSAGGMQDLMSKAGSMDDTLAKWKAKTELWGAALKNPAVAMKMLQVSALAMAASFAKDLFGGALKFKQELGLGAGEAAKLSFNVTVAEKATKLMGGDASLIAASASEMVKQFGDTSVFTAAIAADMVGLALSTGFGGANAATLLKTMEGISGASIETNINTLEAWGNLAQAAGVSQKLVLDDVAKSTNDFARFAKDGGDNIIKAAIAASKLGLELADAAKIADSLLSIEDSLRNEMEAEMLIGKQLNLDKARELALAGDLEGVMNEVKNIGVSQAEWSEMNVIQRQALAKAVGVEVADMGKILAGEKTSAQVAEETAKKKEAGLGREKGLQIALASATAGAAAAQLMGAIPAIMKSFAQFPFGVGIPLGIAAVGSMIGLVAGAKSIVGLEEGGVVKETGMAQVHAGEVFSGTKNEMGFGADMTVTNGLIKKHIAESKQLREQNQFLMNKLIRATGDLQLANA